MPLPRSVARFNRRVTNRVLRPMAGLSPRFVVLVHTGRKSGRTYETPLNAFPTTDGFVIPMTYGPSSEWVRNVLAAGSATLRVNGHEVRVTEPEIVHDPGRALAPRGVRLPLAALRVEDFLRVRRAS